MRTIFSQLLAIALCFAYPFEGFAQTSVKVYQPGVTATGVTYYLPTTKFHISITAKRTSYKPGEYCDFAALYLRIDDVVKAPFDVWEITDIKLEPFGVADKTHAYSITFGKKSIAPLVGLAPDGRLLSINAEASDVPPLTQASVVKIKSDAENGRDYMTEEILSAGSRAKMAELTAAEIYDIRENRSLLSKGQADFMPKDGEQLRLMLETLDKQEAALMSLFKGTSSEETHVFTFDYSPMSETSADLLFRFSRHYGFSTDDDFGATPYYISIVDNRSLPNAVERTPKMLKKLDNEVRYIVPGNAHVKIFNPLSTFVSIDIPVAQFGRIEYLGGELFNKNATTKLQLSPATGGIKSITK